MVFQRIFNFAKSRGENVFMLFMVGSVASELMWIIRLRNEHDRIEERTSTDLKVMDNVIKRLKNGEKFDVDHELMVKEKPENYDDIFKDLRELDQKWRAESVQLPKAVTPSKTTSSTGQTDSQLSNDLSGLFQTEKPETANNQSSAKFL